MGKYDSMDAGEIRALLLDMAKRETIKMSAGDATGMYQLDDLVICNESEVEISLDEARDLIMQGKPIKVLGAGASTFYDVFDALGFDVVEEIDMTSSAGDWSFLLKHRKDEYYCFGYQNNAWPSYGFEYIIDLDTIFPTEESAWEYLKALYGWEE